MPKIHSHFFCGPDSLNDHRTPWRCISFSPGTLVDKMASKALLGFGQYNGGGLCTDRRDHQASGNISDGQREKLKWVMCWQALVYFG